MKKTICKADAVTRLDHRGVAGATGFSYHRQVAAQPRALFAAPGVDLLTLVVAESLKRRAQAEIRRDALRDALYEMSVPPDWNNDRSNDRDNKRERDTQSESSGFDE